MFKIDEEYTDYYKAPDEKYPGGSAVNSSGSDTFDGTPWLDKMFNNCIGWMQALYIKAFGSLDGISGDAENAQTSDVVHALDKIRSDNNEILRGEIESVSDSLDAVSESFDAFKNTKGQANGLAPLDSSGKVSSTYLPSYVDDVLEYASLSAFPTTGEAGKIYVAKDTNKDYRWSGSSYIELSKYDNATQAASGLMSAADKKKLDGIEPGAEVNTVTSVSGRTGAVTTAQIKSDIGDMKGASATEAGGNGLVPAPAAGKQDSFLRGDGKWEMPPATVIESLLSTSSTNAVWNKVITENVNGVLCSTAAATQVKAVSDKPTGFILYEGAVVRVLFKNANTASNPQLNINGTGGKAIVSYRNGSAIALGDWDAYTTMELMYDGTNWVVMGNPVVKTYLNDTENYVLYANGFKKEWGYYVGSIGDDGRHNILFPEKFSTSVAVNVTAYDTDNTGNKSYFIILESGAPDGTEYKLSTGFRFCNADNLIKGFYWAAEGF